MPMCGTQMTLKSTRETTWWLQTEQTPPGHHRCWLPRTGYVPLEATTVAAQHAQFTKSATVLQPAACVSILAYCNIMSKRVQKLICEVTKVYCMLILPTNHRRTIAPQLQTQTSTDSLSESISSSTITQNSPILQLMYPPRCIVMTCKWTSFYLQTHLSNITTSVGNISTMQSLMVIKENSSTGQPPTPQQPPPPVDCRPDNCDNCSALTQYLFSHTSNSTGRWRLLSGAPTTSRWTS
jgi:hypothetical protein